MKNWVTTKELSSALDYTPRWINKKAEEENWPFKTVGGKGRGGKVKVYAFEGLPKSVQTSLTIFRREALALQKSTELKELHEYPKYQQEIAENRFYLIEKYKERLLDARSTDPTASRAKVMAKFCSDYSQGLVNERVQKKITSLSPRTLMRWIGDYEDLGISGLVPAYGKRAGQTLIPKDEQNIIKEMHKDTRQMPTRDIWEHVVRQRARKLQNQYIEEGKDVPYEVCKRKAYESMYHYTTALRFVKNTFTKADDIYFREGSEAFTQKVLAHVQRDPTSIPVNSAWVSDGHKLNLWVKDTYRKGKKVRPIVVAYQDIHSRLITGFAVGATENTQLVLDALSNSIENFGVPDSLYLDNGKAFKNKQTMGISRNKMKKKVEVRDEAVNPSLFAEEERVIGAYGRFGVKVRYANPYGARSKQIEPFWGALNNFASRLFPTYCGRDITEKPCDLPARLADAENIPTMEELIEFLTVAFEEHNTRIHSGKGMNGRMPIEAWKEGIKERGGKRTIDPEQLALLRLWRDKRKVDNEGIDWQNMCYNHAALVTYHDEWVQIGVDRRDLSHIYVFDPDDGSFVCKADRMNTNTAYLLPGEPGTMEELANIQRLNNEMRKIQRKEKDIKAELLGMTSTIEAEKVEERTIIEKRKKIDDEDTFEILPD